MPPSTVWSTLAFDAFSAANRKSTSPENAIGERAAIQLAVRIGAELVLIDEREGAAVARSMGLAVTGTLGILDLAAGRGLLRLHDAVERLKTTSFRCRPEIMDALLARHAGKSNEEQ